jgi:hypothetical protein
MHVDEIYGYFNDTQALLPEISGSDNGEGNDSRLVNNKCVPLCFSIPYTFVLPFI